jgi:soluble lytic murein transglycosylase-like protein
MPQAQIESILRDRLRDAEASQIPGIAEHLLQLCRRFRFDPAFVLALIQAESGFRVRAESPAGALGLMQLMPASAALIARDNGWKWEGEASLFDPRVNLTLGMSYLAHLRHRYRGRSPYFFIAAYNIGPARMDELLARPSFRPVQTLKYYREIQKWLPTLWRYPITPASGEGSRLRRSGGGTRV